MIYNSIRWRVQTWHGLILVLVLIGFGFTAYQVAWDNQSRRVDQELKQRLDILALPVPREQPPPGRPSTDEPPPDGSPMDGPPLGFRRWERPGPRHDPAFQRSRMRESLHQMAATEFSQTNSYYLVLWQHDGSMLIKSSNAPPAIPMPIRTDHTEYPGAGRSDSRRDPPGFRPVPTVSSMTRSWGEFREAYRFLPVGECLLIGRSMAPELAARNRLIVWLTVAGGAILMLGLAGGWWVATRAIQPIDDISGTAVKIAAGDLSQRINAADTDSELGRLAAVLNSTFARLEASFAHQARFTSDASHELRTPVSVILTQTQTTLSRDRTAPEYREALQACQRAAQRMRKLTESLLELARLDAGQHAIQRKQLDLSRVVRECVELLGPVAADAHVEIRCDLAALPCFGDIERLGQVVTNLLANAIYFNRPGGHVQISSRSENGNAVLTVADNGPGIPDEDLPRIFDRFYRVDKSRSGTQGRTGLGLAICKAIVDAHGGQIAVTSQIGSGSTFQLRLPIIES